MGMFDSLYDAQGHEWQTKAYDCILARYDIGDEVPPSHGSLTDYQVRVLGGPGEGFQDSFATVRDGRLSELPADRDYSLPLLGYFGHPDDGTVA